MKRRHGLLPLAILAASLPLRAADIVLTPPAAGGVSVTNAAGSTTRFRVADDGTITAPGIGVAPGTFTGLCVETATGKIGTCSVSSLISITTGTGLAGGTITSSGTISILASYQLPQSCTSGQLPSSNGAGVWACVTPAASSSGTVTSIATGPGLTGGVITASGTIGLATTQLHPTVACATNEIAKWSGSAWACAAAHLQGGNAFGAPASLGTSDNQAVNLVANNLVALRITPNATSPTLVGGYSGNSVTAGVAAAAVSGGGTAGTTDPVTSSPCGSSCANRVTDYGGTVAGGVGNQAGDGAGTTSDRAYATVSGGFINTASGAYSGVGGGGANTASGSFSTVGGGANNWASADYSSIGGGHNNRASGQYSFAAGRNARTQTSGGTSLDGAFVWADSNNFSFYSTTVNEFSARATGGVRFVTAINGSGVPTAGVTLAAGGGAWASLSDVNAKADFAAVDARTVLAKVGSLPIRSWRYKSQDASIRHIGPTAQDFHAAFAVGESDRTITTIDADGVALTAIQGLLQLVQEKSSRLEAVERELAAIKEKLGIR